MKHFRAPIGAGDAKCALKSFAPFCGDSPFLLAEILSKML
jgi:hypothetical protein